MYWLYLIFFIVAVFTPDIISKDFSFLSEERAEELTIFILGATAFVIFLATEKRLNFQLKERSKIQREASLAAKDLNETYSYIGEVNRKLDILKDITLGIADEESLDDEKETELYRSILHAVQMFTKSETVSLKFIDIKNKTIVKEVGKSKKTKCARVNELMAELKRNYLDIDGVFYVRSLKPINSIAACIGIVKRVNQQKLDDPEMIKMLASQALYVYNFKQKIR